MDELDRLLSDYKVKNADAALLDRIVARAGIEPANGNDGGGWVRQAALCAGIAVIGFFLGVLTPDAQGITYRQQDMMDAIILGPDTLGQTPL